ncbi:E4 ORF1 [Simian mastadenovirus C]|uniref:dUTP diphosphatase n=1 Tax=Simian mastadenovirus C TaxID=1962300 RepID=M9YY48_9ADEN|nr:E4 ORF1 [Simian mastadenovirus C]
MADEAIYVHLLGSRAIMPQQQGFSNLYVLFSPENFVISPRGVLLVSLQLSMDIPRGYLGRLFSLSDMNVRGVFVGAQDIQPSTWWEMSVVLFNHSDEFFYGFRGQPVACLLLERVIYPCLHRASLV